MTDLGGFAIGGLRIRDGDRIILDAANRTKMGLDDLEVALPPTFLVRRSPARKDASLLLAKVLSPNTRKFVPVYSVSGISTVNLDSPGGQVVQSYKPKLLIPERGESWTYEVQVTRENDEDKKFASSLEFQIASPSAPTAGAESKGVMSAGTLLLPGIESQAEKDVPMYEFHRYGNYLKHSDFDKTPIRVPGTTTGKTLHQIAADETNIPFQEFSLVYGESHKFPDDMTISEALRKGLLYSNSRTITMKFVGKWIELTDGAGNIHSLFIDRDDNVNSLVRQIINQTGKWNETPELYLNGKVLTTNDRVWNKIVQEGATLSTDVVIPTKKSSTKSFKELMQDVMK